MKKKRKKEIEGFDLESQVIPKQNYFMCQIDYHTLFQVVKQKYVLDRSHKNYSTISSTHHSLHCSPSLDSLFCDTLLSCNSETVFRGATNYCWTTSHREKDSRSLQKHGIWAAQASQVHSLHVDQNELNQGKALWF